MRAERLIVGISGASAPHYGVRLLEVLREHRPDIETHLVLSEGARRTIELELGRDPDEVCALARHAHDARDLAASIASGSFLTMGMIVAPCSIKTLSSIALSYHDNLLARAADVCLKERRTVVLAVRETPLHAGHLRLMTQASEAGAVILPPVPAFYHQPSTVRDLVDHAVVKMLDQFGVHVDLIRRWSGVAESTVDDRETVVRELPDPLLALLRDTELAQLHGMTFLLLSTGADGWPKQAMISAGEVVAVDATALRLALWPHGSSVRNLVAAGRAVLSFVYDGAAYSVRLRVVRRPDLVVDGTELAAFHAEVEQVTRDVAPYAVLDSGPRFRLLEPESGLARWSRTRQALISLHATK